MGFKISLLFTTFKKVIGIAMINEPYCKASMTGLLEIQGNSLTLKVCDLPFI